MRRSYKIAPGVRLNVSKSGVSTSTKLGKRVTVNSRRGTTVRVAKGVSYTTGGGGKNGGCCLLPLLALSLGVLLATASLVAWICRRCRA
jgi:hypothetical protein